MCIRLGRESERERRWNIYIIIRDSVHARTTKAKSARDILRGISASTMNLLVQPYFMHRIFNEPPPPTRLLL